MFIFYLVAAVLSKQCLHHPWKLTGLPGDKSTLVLFCQCQFPELWTAISAISLFTIHYSRPNQQHPLLQALYKPEDASYWKMIDGWLLSFWRFLYFIVTIHGQAVEELTIVAQKSYNKSFLLAILYGITYCSL